MSRFFRFEIEPEPCSIRESVSWLFFSNDEILAFYHATDSFYNNQSQCILSKELSTSANPDDVVPIEFFPIELYP